MIMFKLVAIELSWYKEREEKYIGRGDCWRALENWGREKDKGEKENLDIGRAREKETQTQRATKS